MPPRPRTLHDAIETIRQEIAERQTALKVLYELLARSPAEAEIDVRARVGAPVPPASTPPPPPDDEPAPANVVDLPQRDAG